MISGRWAAQLSAVAARNLLAGDNISLRLFYSLGGCRDVARPSLKGQN